MADPTTWLDSSDANCWQCGALASTDCAYSLLLVADARRGLVALGHPVTRGKRQDKVRVRVPRCAGCRFRNHLSVIITAAVAFAGAIVAPAVQSLIRLYTTLPAWLQDSQGGATGATYAVGAVVGFVLALVGIGLHRRLSGLRSMGIYPPVIFLMQAGWHYPTPSD